MNLGISDAEILVRLRQKYSPDSKSALAEQSDFSSLPSNGCSPASTLKIRNAAQLGAKLPLSSANYGQIRVNS
jgi:hypothetical protein